MKSKHMIVVWVVAWVVTGAWRGSSIAWADPATTRPAAGTRPASRPASMPATAPAAGGWDDQSDPLFVLKLAHIATQIPNTGPALGQYFYGDDDASRQYLKFCTEWTEARAMLRVALTERFGPNAPSAINNDLADYRAGTPDEARRAFEAMGDPAFKEIDRLAVRITGDEAVIHAPGADLPAIHARRFAGKWRINFRDTTGGPVPPLAGGMATAALEVQHTRLLAARIAAGKIKTLQDAKREREELIELERKSFEAHGGRDAYWKDAERYVDESNRPQTAPSPAEK